MARLTVRAFDDSLRDKDSSVAKTATPELFLLQAAKKGILQGMPEGGLAPEAATTRAQAVVVLSRLRTVLDGGILEIDAAAVADALHRMIGSWDE
jgi:hypothetical protein